MAITFGLPRMNKEAGERRDFLPSTIARIYKYGAQAILEQGYGSGMGFSEDDYLQLAPDVRFASKEEAYRQEYVLVLRCPDEDELHLLRQGACLISMLHYPTRPSRVALLRSLGLEGLSLDSIKDDSGRRMIENLRAVAWNGVQAAFQVLSRQYPAPGFESPRRKPVFVTLLGAGAVGSHVMGAAVNYGDHSWRNRLAGAGVPGVQLTAVDYDLTGREEIMQPILEGTDLLVDATQRPDPTTPIIPNDWISWTPLHAVLLDLSVDPYECGKDLVASKGIEGIPQGNLDQYIFAPDDPAYERVPPCFSNRNRRYAVSCYSWPGIYPVECMEVYGWQLQPILRTIIEKGGIQNIQPEGRFFERAIARALLSRWA